MNYRHDFHAGNFADVHKHVVLARIVEYLKRKDAAFRVIDTHAGSGLYDLRSDPALRTGEWVDGEIKGQGTAKFPNGSIYVGEFAKGRPEGKGKLGEK